MVLAIDVGNTNIVIGVLDGEKISLESRIDTNSARMADQYAMTIMDILEMYKIELASIDGAIISSVVPPVTQQLRRAVKTLFGLEAVVVGPGVKNGLNILIDDPSTLGADMVCVAVAAKAKYNLPCIVVDLGTANKVLAIDKNGSFLGGVIAPGIGMSFEALASGTAALPLISDGPVSNVIGTNTVDCMRSGVLVGTACMVDGLVTRYEEIIGESEVVVTGGLADTISPYCRHKMTRDEHLIMSGMRIIYEKNRR